MAKINQIEIGGSTYDLQDKSFFTGTTAEVTAAIAAGTIKEGDIVNVTDDNTKGSSNTVLDTMEEIMANTSSGIGAGALAVKELNNNLGGLKFGYDGDSNTYGYYGADGSLIPFKSSNLIAGYSAQSTITIDFGKGKAVNGFLMQSTYRGYECVAGYIKDFGKCVYGARDYAGSVPALSTIMTYDSSTGIVTLKDLNGIGFYYVIW